jgi:hypothetical protein
VTKRRNLPKGPPPKRPPANAAARIEQLAATGHSVVGISRGLNVTKEVVARWIEQDPALAEALARGREAERFVLHNVLYRAAKRGNIVAAMFLLKARHGYREGDQSDTANKISLTFTLPAALQPEQFTATIEHEAGNQALPVPGKSLTRA